MKQFDIGKYFAKAANCHPLFIVVPLGILLTLFSFWEIRAINLERLHKKFEGHASYLANTIRHSLDMHIVEVDELYSFYVSRSNVSKEQFIEYVNPTLTARTGIRALAWVPQVSDQDRPSYEAAERGAGLHSFSITELDANRRFVTAGKRDYYYPVRYGASLTWDQQAAGYDFGSEDIRRAALERARDTGEAATTAPVRMLRDQGNQSGFLVFKPVYQADMPVSSVEQRRAALKGLVVGVFRSGDLVQGAVASAQTTDMIVKLVDITEDQSGRELARINPQLQAAQPCKVTLSGPPMLLSSQNDFNSNGRTWRIEVEASPQYIEDNLVLSHWSILPGGGMLTLVISLMVRSLYSEITRRKRIESVLKASEEVLISKNMELAEALQTVKQAQARLVQQEKLAGIGQLAAGVAHEINNPLGYVSSNVEVLEKYFTVFTTIIAKHRELRTVLADDGDPQIKKSIQQIDNLERELDLNYILKDLPELFGDTSEGLMRMSKLVKGMRFFARTDQRPVFERYDLNKGLENTLLVAQNELKYHANVGQSFATLPDIEAISGEMNQVLLNLIVNAGQAVKEKKLETTGIIQVTTWHDGEFVYCSVEDNGIGIAPENLNSIFNPFFTTKPVGDGTGLGLSISYDIVVNRHHGEITVESVYGKGAKFTIKLPINQDYLPVRQGDSAN
jgi:signal transduction histidine kinase